MNTPPAGGITMPNRIEMGGENAPLIMAQLERRYHTCSGNRQLSGFVISGTNPANGERYR